MNNLIIQFFVSVENYEQPKYNHIGVNEELYKYSKLSVEKYAKKIGCDYKLITESKINYIHPTFERMDLFFNDDWWTNYDNILYLDTDVIVWPNSPNIFSEYPNTTTFKPAEDRIAKMKSVKFHIERAKDTCLQEFHPKVLQDSRFNAGVFMLNKESAQTMRGHLDFKNLQGDDNEMLIYAMLKSGVNVEKLDWRYNKKNGTKCYFGHAMGQQKFNDKYDMLELAKATFN